MADSIDNAEILKLVSEDGNCSARKLNNKINVRFNINSNAHFYAKVDEKIYKITPENCQIAFIDAIWKNLSLESRLRVMKWQERKYLLQNRYKKLIPKFEYIPSYDDYYGFLAVAKKDEGIFINLEKLAECDGIDAFVVITHECMHYLDFEKCENLIKSFAPYLKHSPSFYSTSCIHEIMQLPVDGKIKNYKTGKLEVIDENLRNNILFLKNNVVTILKSELSPAKRKYSYTKEKFKQYLSKIFYYTSPLEFRAYLNSISYTINTFKTVNNFFPISEVDEECLKRNQKLARRIVGRVREIQKYYKIPHYRAVNMELINEYNQKMFGSVKSKYLSKQLMETRETIIRNLWEEKFGYYGKYEKWEKGD